MGPECRVLIEPEAMLKHGAADGAPRGKHTENQSTTVAKPRRGLVGLRVIMPAMVEPR